MKYLGLKISARAHSVDEIGAQKSNERELRRPRVRDVVRHVARVCEPLISPWRVPESLDQNAFEHFGGWESGARWRYDANVDPLVAQCDCESKNERPGSVSFPLWKGVR
jgi:hypothetical protein